MAEYVYSISDVTLKATWNRAVDYLDGGEAYYQSFNITSGNASRTVDISDITLGEGENIKSVVLSASITTTGTSTSGTLKVNSVAFGGTRKLDPSTMVLGEDFALSFTYGVQGNGGACPTAGTIYSFSSTKSLTNITLTVVTGTGSVFDGKVSSLNEGDKIFLEEAENATAIVTATSLNMRDEPSTDGAIVTSVTSGTEVTILEYGLEWTKVAYGDYVGYMSNTYLDLPITGIPLYTLVHHEYNDGKALLFRDTSIGNKSWRSSVPSSTSNNIYQGGSLDTYLTNEWHPSLSESASQFIQSIDYPVSDSNNTGSTVMITRMACTLSAVETGLGGITKFGTPWNYTSTLAYDSEKNYWTREYVGGMNYARSVSYKGNDLSNAYITNTLAVRPTIGVLEEQLVIYSEDDGAYLFASQCTAPDAVYINGTAADVTGLKSETNITLSWSEGTSGYNAPVSGYAVWYSTSVDGEYELYGTTTETSMVVVGPAKGNQTYYFKVQTLGPEEADYCNSELSSVYLSAATRVSNVYYYDGTRWILAAVKYYNGSAWVEAAGPKYYDGTQWIE